MTHDEYQDLIELESLGALTPEESGLLEEHLRTCASCRGELDQAREAAASLALAADPVAPPPEIRSRVLGSVNASRERATRRAPLAWMPLAAAFAIVIVGGVLYLAVQRNREQLRIARNHIALLNEQKQEEERSRRELERKLEALTGAGATIELAGQEVAPASSARVFINEDERTALVFFQNLPPSPADKSYQLWIIRGDRPEPQSAGVFEVGPDGQATLGLQNLPVDTEIRAFAVTLEPRGGASSPTGSKYLVGG